MKRDVLSVVEGFWSALIAGDVSVTDLFADHPRISNPPAEDREGRAALAEHFDTTHRWLAAQDAAWKPVATTRSPERVVHEGVLTLRRGGREIALPVATVADIRDSRISWLRVYHSMWPLEGKHAVRPPLLRVRHDVLPSGVVRDYQEALARGDLQAVVSAFGPDGCAREPSGGVYTYCGREQLRDFYSTIFSNSGGISLEHCTITDDGVRSAIEYNAVRWGGTALPPQAGIAVYERGPDGLLAAARIYDDVDPPI